MQFAKRFVIGISIAAISLLVASAQSTTESVATETGTPVMVQGQVLDTTGTPIAGAVVEIWQTDQNGIYNHPNDSTTSQQDSSFQYFGTSTSDADGYYAFYTFKPAAYEPRPPHIHVRVKIDGETVLTTQFYFPEDRTTVAQDGAFRGGDETLFVQVVETTDETGNVLFVASNNLVLDLNGSDSDTLAPTASQTEGPYYPVVDFSSYDNNLLNAVTDEEPLQPVVISDAESTTEMVAFTLLNLNTASGDDFLTIPNMSNRMVREFQEYRPYVSIQQFRREIGKYVDAATVAGYEEYVYVPVQINASDAATLMQIEGVDQATADALIAARPFADDAAFLGLLAELAPAVNVDYAANYLE
jgi:protocatechuate 3,4-dioxygenase beta subunit/DNA uptake protein ComE-like DNA-binding protein